MEKYLEEYKGFRADLQRLFEKQEAKFGRKEVPWGLGSTWGYWLEDWRGERPHAERSAASIGEDEIKFFFDLAHLVRPRLSYIIGNSFGLSTFVLALAAPQGIVVAIDNWSEPFSGEMHRELCNKIISETPLPNAHLFSGSSPRDTTAALEKHLDGNSISIAFIDGLHRNEPAYEDYTGLIPFLTSDSVVLWHNVNLVHEGFTRAFKEHGATLFDTCLVLRTHGPLGIFFSRERYPLLDDYLRINSLLWPEWERYIFVLEHEAFMRNEIRRRRTLSWKALTIAMAPVTKLIRLGSDR